MAKKCYLSIINKFLLIEVIFFFAHHEKIVRVPVAREPDWTVTNPDDRKDRIGGNGPITSTPVPCLWIRPRALLLGIRFGFLTMTMSPPNGI